MDNHTIQDKNKPLSKKERKLLRKQEKLELRENVAKREKLIQWITWGSIGVVTFLIIIGLALLVKNSPPRLSSQNVTSPGGSDHIRGSASASATLIEYSDFQCPACAAYHPMVKQLLSDFPDRVRLVYRHFPLSQHAHAKAAAYAAEAAGLQGKFWEMHDIIFEGQDDWSEVKDPQPLFQEYAKQLKLDLDTFAKDKESDVIKSKVEADVRSGNDTGVNATPTFYLNGKQITPRNYQEFKKMVEAALVS